MDNETKNFLTNVANRIEQVRELRGLSRQEVATAAGLTYAGMHAIGYEKNPPKGGRWAPCMVPKS
jgi:DNA-binding XRE family transcriptional regulator